MRTELENYRVFCCVARCGSVSRAAERLFASQPNVSRAIKRMEAELGCALFLRTNRGVSLTAEGEALFAKAEPALKSLAEAEEALLAGGLSENGSVAFGVTETALLLRGADALGAFHRAHPGIRLKVRNCSTPQAVAAVEDGSIELALATSPTDARRPLRETPVCTFRELLIAAPPAPEAVTFEALSALPLIGLGVGTKTYEYYRRLFASRGLPYEPCLEAETVAQLLPLVKSGLGFGFVPEILARSALAQGEVAAVPLSPAPPPRSICLVEDPRRPLSPAARELRAALISEPNAHDFS